MDADFEIRLGPSRSDGTKVRGPIPLSQCVRLKLTVRGAVQGVGFRPYVFRLATELGLRGWVNNSPHGVFIEVEGLRTAVESFRLRLESENPPRSFIQSLEATWLDAVGFVDFAIRKSETGGAKTALVLPDIATCPECVQEIFDPNSRRHRYPFTNCTHCGPRFSIIEDLPYDRAHTSMRKFKLCPACQAEYDNPRDRRFHAQPNACPKCGPRLEFWSITPRKNFPANGTAKKIHPHVLARNHDALLAAVEAIRNGQIVAVKGLGGFHLMVAAHDEAAIRRLRERKHREEKPLAVMFPSIESVKAACKVSPLEERLLRSPEAPIVLLRRQPVSDLHPASSISPNVAPNNSHLGALLPFTPLHHLLLAKLGFPVVATSGNLSDEPICTDEHEALERLHHIADFFLVHNRPIVRHVDDSIVRVMLEREMILRRARGYAPLPVTLNSRLSTLDPRPVLAVGAHLKNSIALAVRPQIFVSQHIGDLESEQAFSAFRRVIGDFEKLYDTKPGVIACDLHPDYLSSKFADDSGKPVIPVQHHIAHVLSCMAENELVPPVLGVAWDGTGYGTDGTIWGGEFFLVTDDRIERVAHLRPFRLPGGDKAVREPRRTALGLLYEMFGDAIFLRKDISPIAAFSEAELAVVRMMLTRGLNSPPCSSIGRLFDAVASLIDLRQQMRFEGQAAMELEFALDGADTNEAYKFLTEHGPAGPCPSPIVLDWAPMVETMLADVRHGVGAGLIAAKFHNALAKSIAGVANRLGQHRVVLSGGCFQNQYLTERAVRRLQKNGLRAYWHQRVPPNDGGIALGQVMAARRALNLVAADVSPL